MENKLQNEELLAAREATQAERERYYDLFENAPDGYLITNVEGSIWEANRAAGKLLHVEPRLLAGAHLISFVAGSDRPSFRSLLAEIHRQPPDTELIRTRPDGNYHEGELSMQPDGGDPFVASIAVSAIFDRGGIPVALRWQMRDITESKRTQAALHQAKVELEATVAERTAELRRANQRLGIELQERTRVAEESNRLIAILEATPDLVATATIDGRVLYLNRSAREILGIGAEPGEIIFPAGFPKPAAEMIEKVAVPKAIKRGIWSGESAVLSHTGGEIPISLVILAHRDPDGRVTYLSIVARDISDLKREEQIMRRDAERSALLATLSQAFAEAGLKYPEVAEVIAERISETSGDACVIRILSEDNLWLDPVAFRHPDAEAQATLDHLMKFSRQRADEGIPGLVLKTGKPRLIRSLQDEEIRDRIDPYFLKWMERFPICSAIFAPLRVHGRIIGSMGLLRAEAETAYTEDDLGFYQDLADRASLAIENARLYLASSQRAQELNALHTATAALLSTLDFEALLAHILDAALSAIPKAETGTLHLIAPETGQLQIRAVTGYSDPRIQQVPLATIYGYPAKAVQMRQPLLISDIHADLTTRNLQDIPEISSARSAIVTPLILGEKTLGVLSLTTSGPETFCDADLRLLVSFANTTTTAIHNAMLHSEVQKQAITDTLTSLYNRRGFFELAQREIDRAHLFHHPLSAIIVDIDHFKEVNDRYGHQAGDQVLQIMAERLQASLRDVDILGRYGGEEFVILLPETDLFAACTVAERIRASVSQTIRTGKALSLKITASFGVAGVVPETHNLAELLERADRALYAAKRGGRNRVEVS